jgi:hypothetical protein
VTDFWAAEISLCTDYVHVAATAPASALRVTSAWGGAEGVQLAANGDFFTAGPRVYGHAIGGGRAWPARQTGTDPAVAGEWYYRRYGWIGFGPGRVEFSHTEWVKERAATLRVRDGWMPATVTTTVPPGITQLVSGFPELVTEGTRYTCASPTATGCFPDRSDMRARHPRTAMGLTRDRRTFLLVAVDGRSTRSAGMYGTELARLMELLGAWQAFNLDGGGSSQLWVDGRGTVNDPSDGSPRPVANLWGVYAGTASGRPATPGSCVPPDMGMPDMGIRDMGIPDMDVSDMAVPDAGMSDAGIPDSGIVDGAVSEMGIVDASLSRDTGISTANPTHGLNGGCACRVARGANTASPGTAPTLISAFVVLLAVTRRRRSRAAQSA